MVQWDGWVCDGQQWDPAYLEYDYIGAVWPQFDEPRNVGNGGFSLRSRRLIEALTMPGLHLHHPEDIAICHSNRDVLEHEFGIRFAPPSVARRFAFEREQSQRPTLGFHGLFNFPTILPDSFRDEIASLPSSRLCNRDAIDLFSVLSESKAPEDRKIARRIAACVVRHSPHLIWRLLKARALTPKSFRTAHSNL
jgi:hypothetical protein